MASYDVEGAETAGRPAMPEDKESFYRTLLEDLPELICRWRSDGTITFVNARYCDSLGKSAEELLGHNIYSLLPDHERDAYRAHIASLTFVNPVGTMEHKVIAADGAERWHQWTHRAIFDPAGKITELLAVGRDISTRRRAERSLADIHRRLESVADLSPVGIFYTDAAGACLFVNRKWCEITGLSVEQARGRGWSSALHPEDRNILDAWLETCQNQQSFRGEYRLVRPDGVHTWVLGQASPEKDGDGTVTGYVGTVTDITIRYHAEQSLRADEARLRNLLEAQRDGLLVVGSEGVVRFANQAAVRLTGRNKDRLIGSELGYVLVNGDKAEIDVISGSERRGVAEVGVTDIDWHGRSAFVVSLHDVTEQRHKEERLRRLNRTHKVLTTCGHALVRAENEQDLLKTYCRNLVASGDYLFAWVGYVNEDQQLLAPVACHGHDPSYLELIQIPTAAPVACLNPVGLAVTRARTVVERDLIAVLRDAPWRRAAEALGYRAVTALPLKELEVSYGVLAIYAKEASAFDDEEVALLEQLAADLSYGIQALRSRVAHRQAVAALNMRNRALEATRNGIMIIDLERNDHPIIFANGAFTTITGYGKDEVLGRNPRFLQGKAADQPALAELRYLVRNRREGSVLLKNFRKDGSLFWNELHVAPVYDEHRRPSHYVGVINDITERKRYEEQLELRSNYDDVTGLPNRNLLRDRLQQALMAAQRHKGTVAVMMIDIDQFNIVNEALGHRQSDVLLKAVGERLATHLRGEDTLARFGGNEFIVLLSQIKDEQDVIAGAERLRQSLAAPLTLDGRELSISVSIGVSLYPRDGEEGEILLKHAGAAMYQAKQRGRNYLQFYTATVNQRMMERLGLETRLRRALEQGQLRLHYQPQVDVGTRRVIGAEALLRWQEPEQGLIMPAGFIPFAEESGLIVPIGEWVLREACMQAKAWHDDGYEGLSVAINLSGRNICDEQLIAKIKWVLEETGLNPSCLEAEITESALISDPEEMEGRLRRIKALGVRLALDDFGTGYSSLSYLKRYSFDRLKIDRTFVTDITTDPDVAAIARTIIAMAHSLRLDVIAEGIEKEAQLQYLHRHGCDQFQGFLFSPALAAGEFTQLLARPWPLAAEDGDGGQRPAVLVLDDEINITNALRRLLRREAYRVLTANSAAQAFNLLATNNIKVIISDQRMPDMSGTEFLSRVKELYPEAVRMILSGYTELNAVTEAVNKGWIYKFLTKPWDDQALIGEIREALRQYQRQAERRSE